MKLKLLMITSLACNIVMPCFGIDQQVAYADEKRIVAHKDELALHLYNNSWIRLVTKSALGATAIAACYTMFKGFSIVPSADLNAIKEQAGKNAGQIAILVAYLKHNNPDAINDEVINNAFKSSGGGWGRFLANTAVSLGFGAAFNYASQSILTHVFFDPDIEWFIQNKTSMSTLFKEIEALNQSVISPVKSGQYVLTDYQRNKYMQDIIALHARMVCLTEKIIAYLDYKASMHDLILKNAQEGAISSYLLTRINHEDEGVATKLHLLNASYGIQHTQEDKAAILCNMFDEVHRFSAELVNAINMFATIELQK